MESTRFFSRNAASSTEILYIIIQYISFIIIVAGWATQCVKMGSSPRETNTFPQN